MVDLSDGPFEYSVNNVVFVVPGIVVVGLAVIDHLSREWNVYYVCTVLIVFQEGLFLIGQVAAAEAPGASVEDNAATDFEKQIPTPEQLLEMLDSMTGFSEEEKNSLKQELLGNLRGGSQQSLGGNDMTTQTVVLLSLLGVVALIFGLLLRGGIMAEIIMNALKSKGMMPEGLEEKLSGLMSDEAKEKLSRVLEKYKSLSEEEKEEFVDTVFGKLRESVQERVEAAGGPSVLQSHSYTIFFVAVFLITLVIVFFVYKLFKCLSEREAKREEKKKQKQLKKKK